MSYLIHYRDQKSGEIVNLKAKSIEDSALGISFISISDFIFDTHSIILNPEEESKKKQFEEIKTLHLSIYSIVSIAELGDHSQKLSFKNDRSNLLMLNSENRPPN